MLDAIDFILNLAGLLLWLNWRSVRHDPFNRGVPATLGGTVRRAEPMRLERWHFLAGLGALLFIRAIFYGQLGPAVNWSPKLDLMIVSPAFPLTIRGRVFFLSILLFSILSFVRILTVFYVWLLALAIVNRRVTSPDPLHKIVQVQLGRVARWPVLVQLIAPLIIIAALWILWHGPLVHIGVTSHVRSMPVLLGQGLIIALAAYFSLKYLALAFLAVYVVVNYVYLGNNPLWDFITTTSKNLLSPLNRLPLRIGRVNLAPLLGIALLLIVFYWPVPAWVRYYILDRFHLTLWPQ
jgi:uncharacterized protein YggT (Ycf19 family)